MYGAIRGRVAGRRSVEGTSLAGSTVARWRANPRATQSRWRQRCGCACTGSLAHFSASSEVILRPGPLAELNEPFQQPAVVGHLEPEPAADPKIVGEGVASGHAAPPCKGHGRASARSAVRSTLA